MKTFPPETVITYALLSQVDEYSSIASQINEYSLIIDADKITIRMRFSFC